MKNRVVILGVFAIILLPLMSFTGNWETITRNDFDKVMGQVGAYFDKHSTYSVNVTHASYKGYEALSPFDKMNGFYKKDGNNYSSLLLGIRTIQGPKLRVVIDSLKRSIMVTEPVTFKNSDLTVVNYEYASSYVISYKEMSTTTGTLYRVEFNDSLPRYAAYEIEVTKNNIIRDIVIYFRDSYSVDMSRPNAPKTHPKVRIDFENFNDKAVFTPEEFDVSKYVMLRGNDLVITGAAYKNYRLVDARYSSLGKSKVQHTTK
jgi:hypothetical protein